MRRLFPIVIAALLLAGAGCPGGRAVIATPDMLPKNLAIMPGLEPADASSWRVVGTKEAPRIDTRWRTDALYDKVEAFYLDYIGKNWGLATHTVEDKSGVRIYWGLTEEVRWADKTNTEFISIAKEQTGGKTLVQIVISPRTP